VSWLQHGASFQESEHLFVTVTGTGRFEDKVLMSTRSAVGSGIIRLVLAG
jgi:hypothetical protein